MNKGLIIVFIVGVVVISGVYWYAQQDYEPVSVQQNSPATIEAVSADDSAQVIEEELYDTNIDDLGAEFDDIGAEIDAALQTP